MYEKLFRNKFGNVHFFAEDGGGGGGGETPAWHADHPCLSENPEASKAYSKYSDVNEALKGGHEAMKKTGRAYWLPEKHDKLSDDQKNEIRANVAVMEGIPETADGYVINPPKEGPSLDAQGVTDFKVFAKGKNIPPGLAQELSDFQGAFVARMMEQDKQSRIADAKENFLKMSKDLGSDANAITASKQMQNYLQSLCKDDKGNPDPKKWEKLNKRMFFEDKIVEEVLGKAIMEQARKHAEGGGTPGGQATDIVKGSDYSEMKK